jgi:outer membrane protein TolC
LSEDGSDNWAIIFGLNVPIWFDKIEAGIREAKRKLSASMHEYTSAKNMVHFRIEDALAKVHAQQELAELFDSTIIPQAKQAYEVSRTGYVVGKSDFLDVIDNWQKWLVFTIQYHRAIGELERSVADLEQTIGLSLVEVESLQ